VHASVIKAVGNMLFDYLQIHNQFEYAQSVYLFSYTNNQLN